MYSLSSLFELVGNDLGEFVATINVERVLSDSFRCRRTVRSMC